MIKSWIQTAIEHGVFHHRFGYFSSELNMEILLSNEA